MSRLSLQALSVCLPRSSHHHGKDVSESQIIFEGVVRIRDGEQCLVLELHASALNEIEWQRVDPIILPQPRHCAAAVRDDEAILVPLREDLRAFKIGVPDRTQYRFVPLFVLRKQGIAEPIQLSQQGSAECVARIPYAHSGADSPNLAESSVGCR